MRSLMRPALVLLLVRRSPCPRPPTKRRLCTSRARTPRRARTTKAPTTSTSRPMISNRKTCATGRRSRGRALKRPPAAVHRGQKLREDGKLDEALAAFQKAVAIDPSMFIAQQELARTQKMIENLRNPPAAVRRPAHESRTKGEGRRGSRRAGSHLEHSHHRQDARNQI